MLEAILLCIILCIIVMSLYFVFTIMMHSYPKGTSLFLGIAMIYQGYINSISLRRYYRKGTIYTCGNYIEPRRQYNSNTIGYIKDRLDSLHTYVSS